MKPKNCKVGTRVVVKRDVIGGLCGAGQTGTIEDSDGGFVKVRFDVDGDYWYLYCGDLKLLNKGKRNED